MTHSYVMITGATGGLGKAFAAECASHGWNLFLTDLNAATLQPLATGLERMYGVRVLCQPANLTDADAREALWQHIGQMGLRFHFLINVAGLDYEGLFNEREISELRTILRLNIESTVEMTSRALRHRDPAQTLRIINVSSLAAFYPMPVKATYASSKRFLLDWSLALNQELRSCDVSVTVLCPAGMPSRPEILRLIDAQGLMGHLTTTNVGDVAAGALKAALKEHALYIPGAINRVLRVLGSLAPPQLVAMFIDRRWRKVDQRAQIIAPVPAASLSLTAEHA